MRRLSGQAQPSPGIAETGWIGIIAARHLVTFRRPAPGEDPAAAGGGAIISQLRKGAQLLAFLTSPRRLPGR